jgi:hypothetical protein
LIGWLTVVVLSTGGLDSGTGARAYGALAFSRTRWSSRSRSSDGPLAGAGALGGVAGSTGSLAASGGLTVLVLALSPARVGVEETPLGWLTAGL